jgi:hypothetical protein
MQRLGQPVPSVSLSWAEAAPARTGPALTSRTSRSPNDIAEPPFRRPLEAAKVSPWPDALQVILPVGPPARTEPVIRCHRNRRRITPIAGTSWPWDRTVFAPAMPSADRPGAGRRSPGPRPSGRARSSCRRRRSASRKWWRLVVLLAQASSPTHPARRAGGVDQLALHPLQPQPPLLGLQHLAGGPPA